MPLVAVLAVLLMSRASAAWLWLMISAVAAVVPEVPLTVRPTVLVAVGVMVLMAVLPGTWTMAPTLPAQEPHEGAVLTPPEMRHEPVATSDILFRLVVVLANSKSPTA